ncbi:alpha/beta fold hydrolase [Paenibacillus hemerocallicola]|uniref:Alpha/beta fold hydrolase n=1 Tax=Paenibacillus hemerocallicola TaxID=1172614 RepID=A0A5C4T2F3_9BACL|nr:alpha/beta fold hydrolase [Paenibacillus hemerocallicola]TNJ62309.1 alpha/beta fold hydrolase [Paenibacillus hemerocallicola]
MKKRLNTAGRLAAASLALALAVPAAGVSAQSAPAPSASGQPASQSIQPASPVPAPAAASTVVPLRDFSEAIGAVVNWNEADRTAVVARGKIRILAKIGESAIVVNEKQIQLDKPVQLINEKTVVPLAALNEAFGIKADWNAQTNSIIAAKDDYPLLASAFIGALNGGRFADARGYLNGSLQSFMPEQFLMQYWSSIAQMYGQLGPQLSVAESSSSVHRNATVLYQTSAVAPFEMTVRFDTYGGIDDLYISPMVSSSGYTKPVYEDTTKYSEKEVKIGDGPLALPGTLTMPAGNGPFPAVVLVHGSGPNDRDESIGSVKPFRDLAVGLAAQGIAVLRYEKITREHPIKSQRMIAPFTANEETVDDAVSAVQLLKSIEGIDPQQVYVAGHSQGGMLMPRILEEGKGIAGAIVMSGPSRPLEDLLVEQMNVQLELLKQAGQPTELAEQQVAVYEQQVKLLKDPQYSLDNPPKGFLLGSPAWWLDIRNLYAGEEAADQKVPMLILQGGNDVQVFPDNLDGWKKSLSARSDVEYKLYPKVNHTLVEFDGESTGAEYAVPANVPDYIISDIVKWIKP